MPHASDGDPGSARAIARRGVPLSLVLVFGIGLIVLAAVGLVVLMGYQVAHYTTAELVGDRTDLVLASITERTRAQLDPARAQLDFLASYLNSGRVDVAEREELGSLLLASLAAAPQVSVVAFVDRDLRVLRFPQSRGVSGDVERLEPRSRLPPRRRRGRGGERALLGRSLCRRESRHDLYRHPLPG